MLFNDCDYNNSNPSFSAIKKVPDFPLKTENQELFCYFCNFLVFPESCIMFFLRALKIVQSCD